MPTPFSRDQLSPEMQRRYGLDQQHTGRRIAITLAVLAFVGILGWIGVGLTHASVHGRLLTWEAVGPDQVTMTFSVDRPADTSVTCVLRAQDRSRIDLGYAVVELPAGEASVQTTYRLRTIAPAYTAELLGCAEQRPEVPGPQFPPGVVPPDQPYS